MARFFTSDTHFGDDRFDLFYRPFKTVQEQEDFLVEKWNSVVGPDDDVYHVGDFATTDEGLEVVHRLNGKIRLILGNYDLPRPMEKLKEIFYAVEQFNYIQLKNNVTVYLTHYPSNAAEDNFNLVGHIHSLWKVQRNMINVSSDAWNYTPVSEDQIVFCMNAIKKHYDINVFAGELKMNMNLVRGDDIYADQHIPKIGLKAFLAGPTPRSLEDPSWRPQMIKQLRDAGYNGHILIPEKRDPENGYDYVAQVSWEANALEAADLIVFWVPREIEKMPGFTTNIEFGEWMKSGKVILGFPGGAPKMRYMARKAKEHKIPTFNHMNGVAKYVSENLVNYGAVRYDKTIEV